MLINKRQTHVRKTWLQASKDLSKSKRVEDQQLAKEIISFVKQMPPMKTERHDMMETLAAIHQKQDIKSNENSQER